MNNGAKTKKAVWMKGECVIQISAAGDIIGNITKYYPQTTPRPKTYEESGTNPGTDYLINQRIPGMIQTTGWLGGAIAWMLDLNRLSLLDKEVMANLAKKYGEWDSNAYIALVRTANARHIPCTAEPAGGMVESEDLDAELLGEGTELGIYNSEGWVRFILPNDMSTHQAAFDEEQRKWWDYVRPGFPCRHEARVEFLPVGHDRRNGVAGIWGAGPYGDLSFTRVATVHLEGEGWQLMDCEARRGDPDKGEREWVALKRQVVAICRRTGRPPILFPFTRDSDLNENGKFHPCGLPIVLEGENLDNSLSHLSKPVIAALDWWPNPST